MAAKMAKARAQMATQEMANTDSGMMMMGQATPGAQMRQTNVNPDIITPKVSQNPNAGGMPQPGPKTTGAPT